MKESEKNLLQKRLANLDGHERHLLLKKAHQIRKGMRMKSTKVLDFDDDEELAPVKMRRQSLDDILWDLLQSETAPTAGQTQLGTNSKRGMILSVTAGACQVLVEGVTQTHRLSPALAAMQQTLIAVGDEAVLTEKSGEWFVDSVLPRRTKLSRPDPHLPGHERIIVANIDLVVVVAAVVIPPLRTGLLDRYMVAVQRGGTQMGIAVNKLDLLPSGEERVAELDQLSPYRALEVPVVEVSALEKDGLDDLRRLLRGKLSAFVGHSGVGKSSLLNALKPELQLATGDVSEGYGRGTHTTTTSTLWDLGDETRVIDTPGIRSFGLFKLKAEDLIWYFPEFHTHTCRFRDCIHVHEPACGVREAVEAGQIPRARYQAYLRIRRSLPT